MKPLVESRTLWVAGIGGFAGAFAGSLTTIAATQAPVPVWMLVAAAFCSAVSVGSTAIIALLRVSDARKSSEATREHKVMQ